MLHPDRLLPPYPATRALARAIYEGTRDLPIVSPHGHIDPSGLAGDLPIGDPATELVTKDHYFLRMAYSQGVPLEALGVRPLDGDAAEVDGRQVWRTFAEHYRLFLGTPSKLWLDHTLGEVFGVEARLGPDTADEIYDEVCARLDALVGSGA